MADGTPLDWSFFETGYGAPLVAIGALLALSIFLLPFVLMGLRRRLDRLIEQNAELLQLQREARVLTPPRAAALPVGGPQISKLQESVARPVMTAPKAASPPPILRADVTLRQNRPGQD